MIPTFRDRVLSIPHSYLIALSDEPKAVKEDKAMLEELVALFQTMRNASFPENGVLSEEIFQRSLDLEAFCDRFIELTGESIDLDTQGDVSDFLSQLFSKLLKLDKHYHSEVAVNCDAKGGILSSIMGQLQHVLTSSENDVLIRPEPFFYLSLKVGHADSSNGSPTCHNLASSLQEYCSNVDVQFRWQRQVDESSPPQRIQLPTTKRTALTEVPQHLILHLKRFRFDVETSSRVKLHDRFEFPMEIDLSQYLSTVDSSATANVRAQCWYDLAGVIVHIGSALAGHYYSIIKERTVGCDRCNQWFEFNDEKVTVFDMSQFDAETFGGDLIELSDDDDDEDDDEKDDDESDDTMPQFLKDMSRTAFVLVYDRRVIQ